MEKYNFLYQEINPLEIKKTDLVVAIPSFCEKDNIPVLISKINAGLMEYFADYSKVILISDNNFKKSSQNFLDDIPSETPKIYLNIDPDFSAKGANVLSILDKAVKLEAKVILIVEPDLKNLRAGFVEKFISPIINNDFKFVVPIYLREKYGALLINSIIYPVTRALFGRRIRQPVLTEYSFSGDLASFFLKQNILAPDDNSFKVNLKLIWNTLAKKEPIAQTFLTTPRLPDISLETYFKSLGESFVFTVDTIFQLMDDNFDFWSTVKWSKPTAVFGTNLKPTSFALPSNLDTVVLFNLFKEQAAEEFKSSWREIFTLETKENLEKCLNSSWNSFELPIKVWVKAIYQAAIAYQRQSFDHDLIFKALVPLFFAKVVDFYKKTKSLNLLQTRTWVDSECLVFEEEKNWLVANWPKKNGS